MSKSRSYKESMLSPHVRRRLHTIAYPFEGSVFVDITAILVTAFVEEVPNGTADDENPSTKVNKVTHVPYKNPFPPSELHIGCMYGCPRDMSPVDIQ
eukprot:1056653-Pyramimonas_sp.AAC.1